MFHHEKHQYFYEKYLRNEMPEAERLAFEEKLSADESLRASFNHYKRHRREFLDHLLVDDDAVYTKKSWSLNSWLYLFISLTGIALGINYFVLKSREAPVNEQPQANTWNIFRRIPFLNRKTEPVHHDPERPVKSQPDVPATDTSETASEPEEVNGQALIPESESAGIANDQMELDSFIYAYEKAYFELRFKAIRNETDSIISDSIMDMLTAKSASRNSQQSKPVMVFVEFWRSPVNFKGYKFNGKKLIVYGLSSPYEIYLLKDGDDFILRSGRNEFILTKDNDFHKF